MRTRTALLLIASAAATAACSKRDEGPQAEPASEMSPGVDVTAAPGVAFNYRYAFRLPAARIAGVQEAHAQACERLGLARCRITGMRYTVSNERDIAAALDLRLDPTLARAYGKQGIAAVTEAEGMLTDSEIGGIDAGGTIAAAQTESGEIVARTAELRRRLAAADSQSREAIEQELAALNERSTASRNERRAAEASLAATPVGFSYASGDLMPGLDTTSPIRAAFRTAAGNFIGAAATVIVLLLTLLPWALAAAGIAWGSIAGLRWLRDRGILPQPALD